MLDCLPEHFNESFYLIMSPWPPHGKAASYHGLTVFHAYHEEESYTLDPSQSS